jgi:SAM-dependent methyltransferase
MYYRYILDHIDAQERNAEFSIVDAGCGPGQLAMRLSRIGHQVLGIDNSKPAIEHAQSEAQKEKLSIKFVNAELSAYLSSMAGNQNDIVLCIDVLPFCVNYGEIFAQLSRVLAPGGRLFVTFQPAYYFITTLLRQRKFDAVRYVERNTEGLLRIATVPAYYNWPDRASIEKLHAENGLDLLQVKPIGRYCGFDRDGLAGILDLRDVDMTSAYSRLMEIEMNLENSSVEQCRYVLYVSTKRAKT